MREGFKINTPVLICLAFVFRLLFSNMNAYAAMDVSANKHFIKSHPTSNLKKERRRDNEVVTASTLAGEQVVQELAEENPESEDDSAHPKKSTLLFVLFSYLKGTFDAPKPGVPFDFFKCSLSPKKYLAISVLRI